MQRTMGRVSYPWSLTLSEEDRYLMTITEE